MNIFKHRSHLIVQTITKAAKETLGGDKLTVYRERVSYKATYDAVIE